MRNGKKKMHLNISSIFQIFEYLAEIEKRGSSHGG
jgi:hypothetical protein